MYISGESSAQDRTLQEILERPRQFMVATRLEEIPLQKACTTLELKPIEAIGVRLHVDAQDNVTTVRHPNSNPSCSPELNVVKYGLFHHLADLITKLKSEQEDENSPSPTATYELFVARGMERVVDEFRLQGRDLLGGEVVLKNARGGRVGGIFVARALFTHLKAAESGLEARSRGYPLRNNPDWRQLGKMLWDTEKAGKSDELAASATTTILGRALINMSEVQHELAPAARPETPVSEALAAAMHHQAHIM